MPVAYSYMRFSTPEQSKGDSTRRQTDGRAEKFCNAAGLTLSTETVKDKGLSAFRGKNAQVGALGVFLDGVKTGDIARGSYLLIENIEYGHSGERIV